MSNKVLLAGGVGYVWGVTVMTGSVIDVGLAIAGVAIVAFIFWATGMLKDPSE